MTHLVGCLTFAPLLAVIACTPLRGTHEQGRPVDASGHPSGSDASLAAEASRRHAFGALDSTIRAEIESGRLPSVAYAVARNGQIVHERAIGWADKERKIVSTVSTAYPLASATKPMVATALMMLHERGLVDLNTPALHYASDWAIAGTAEQMQSPYTLRQLLNHTSGLGTYARIAWREQDRPVRSLGESFRKYGFVAQPPGAVSEYSNLGYGVIGHIIAQRSGTSLPQFLKTELFDPLGMRNTMMVESFSAPAGAARKYDASGAALGESYNDTPGAGNIYASVHDLALFGAFHCADDADRATPLLSQQSKLLMRSFVEPGALYPYYDSARYGLGWYFRTNPGGGEVVWHEGGMPGASTILVLLPERRIVAAVAINATDANAQAQSFANALIKAVEPDHQVVSFNATDGFSRFSSQSEFLGRWEGSVRIDGKELPWSLTFESGGTIRAEFPGRDPGDLLPEQVAFPGLVSGDLLVATLAATLPASDVAQTPDGYVLLRLLRRGEELSGTMIAYASPSRLEHLYPFAARLRRIRP
jgi:CubicO group peptidase (beta-lactamase class C family)